MADKIASGVCEIFWHVTMATMQSSILTGSDHFKQNFYLIGVRYDIIRKLRHFFFPVLMTRSLRLLNSVLTL